MQIKVANTKEKDVQKRLNLKNDIIFKAFFARKGNEEFLIDFLNALLKIDIKTIRVQEEVNLEQLQVEEKGGRLDLQAELNDGIIVDIELQIKDNKNIEERTTFYSSKIISKETQRGRKYKDIKKVIMINILNYELLGFDEYVSETAIVLEKHREYEVLKGIKWYFVELPKFRKTHPDMNEKLNQWLAFIDDYDRGLIKMAEEKNKTLEKARFEMNYLTGDAAVRRMAELREKWEMDRISEIDYAETKGKEEKQIEIVKKMLKKEMSIELIMEITELSKEEIENIKKEI